MKNCIPGNVWSAQIWIATWRMDFEILISKFLPLGEGFQGFGPQIRLQHAEISPGTNSEVIWL